MTSPAHSDFDDCPDRRGTGSEKWDLWAGEDVLPLWVADMDFQSPDVVLDAIRTRVDHGVFGYTHEPPDFAPALADHLRRLHGWEIDPALVVATPGVVTGLAITARLLAEPDDEILTFTPVYPPFLTLPGLAGRRCMRLPLVPAGDTWTIDWDAIAAAITPRTKLFWLCHPHNPTGTVFSRGDLLRLADLCERHGITMVSDEIWADLVLDEHLGHVPFASLDHPAAKRAITLVAPSKTWNLAGLGCAAAIVPDATTKKPQEAVAAGWRGLGADGESPRLRRGDRGLAAGRSLAARPAGSAPPASRADGGGCGRDSRALDAWGTGDLPRLDRLPRDRRRRSLRRLRGRRARALRWP
jgi:cystathionine beta-lyase